jgi:cyclohexanecarboxylate-CoA ligase
MVSVHGLGVDDAVLMPAPLAHVSGLLNGVLVPGVAGMKCVLQSRWTPEAALGLIERERVTFMVGPPTFFTGLLDSPSFSTDAVDSLRLVSCGGAGVSPAFVRRASVGLDAVVKRTYGSTEAPTITSSTVHDSPDRRASFDGRALGSVELSIRSVDDASTVAAGDEGELWVRGPELFAGYSSASVTRASVTDDGWFRTGDLARLDDEGWLTITGRLKEVVIRSGENIAIAEVESVLVAHPSVRAAAVVGVPDERTGERVVAFVVVREGEEFDLRTCRTWFEASGVARFKTPEDVYVVDELPLLPSGKVDRRLLASRH